MFRRYPETVIAATTEGGWKMALARVVEFDGVNKDRLEEMRQQMQGEAPPEGVPVKEIVVLHDGDAEKAVVVLFFDDAQSDEAIASARNVDDERLALGIREIYVHFPSGQGRSKLKLGGQVLGTARNLNTVAKLAQLARELA